MKINYENKKTYFILINFYNAYCAIENYDFSFSIILNLLTKYITSFNIYRIKIKTIKTYFINVKFVYINLKSKNLKMFYNF